MKKATITLGLLATVAFGSYVYFLKKKKKEERRSDIADAGYETAHDILYPLKQKRLKLR